jgi:alpha-tubulin suppressor-like RCC1 family protein
MRRGSIGAALACGVVGVSRGPTPTSLTIEVYSEVPCDRQAAAALVTGPSLAELASGAPSASSTKCDADGHLGSVVIVPSGSKDASISFALMTRPDGQSADTCLDRAQASGCIVAKRRLRFEPQHEIAMRLDLRLSCLGVSCSDDQTCVRGACVAADIECGASCDETALLLGEATDGGELERDATLADAGVVDDAGSLDAAGPFDAASLPEGGLSASRQAIAVGAGHACVLLESGLVGCWGQNDRGQLGDGTTTAHGDLRAVLGISDAIAIAAGNAFTCALLGTGEVRCWGDDTRSQLGTGSSTLAYSPTPLTVVNPAGAVAIAAGDGHACAVSRVADDANQFDVRCWGANDDGQLGDGTTVDRGTPVAATNVVATVPLVIGAGAAHTCANTGGFTHCWGNNASGQLGDGTSTSTSTPVVTSTMSGVVGFALGTDSSCLVGSASGSHVLCWGANAFEQLGDGTTTPHSTPQATNAVVSASFGDDGGFVTHTGVAIAAGDHHACMIDNLGLLICWGRNDEGQLADGTTGAPRGPKVSSGLSGVTSVAARGTSTCVLASGAIRCFGTAATFATAN